MLSSPYPVPSLPVWRVAMILGWCGGIVAGTWVLTDPPKSYDNLGLALTFAWGIMLAGGSVLAAFGHAVRRYQVELPGVVLALGGIAVYDYLSWQQTFTTSPGSGPRASLLALLGCFLIARIASLVYIDRQARRLAELRSDLE